MKYLIVAIVGGLIGVGLSLAANNYLNGWIGFWAAYGVLCWWEHTDELN